jgi:MYXO-CTERM domain-containing protein
MMPAEVRMSRRRSPLLALPGAAAAALVAVALLLAAPAPAAAQVFPGDEDYTFLPCGRSVMNDRQRDESDAIDERDLVGQAVDVRAAGYRAVDDDFLYLRMRLDQDAAPEGTLEPFSWGVEFDLDDDRETYELLALVDGITGNVLLYRNTATTTRDDPTDPADTPAAQSYNASTHMESTVASGTSFGDDDDFFLSFALPFDDLVPLGLDRDTPVVAWVASSSVANALDGDFACHDGAGGRPGFSDVDSDRTVLDPDVDSDGDGASDADEVEGGSDPDDPDSRPGGLILAGGGGCAIAAGPGGDASGAVLLLLGALVACRRRRRR